MKGEDVMRDLREDIKGIKSLTADDLLAAVGLETRRTAADFILPALGLFGAGLLVGAGLGMIMAPKSGSELRGELGHRVEEMRHGDGGGA